MSLPLARSFKQLRLLFAVFACVALLAACGGSSENVAAGSAQADEAPAADLASDEDEDHDDEDHDDEDHGDEDHDDHDDEDHDDHGDEDHDDHDDEDKDHDDHDHDDHGDEDHDDHDHDEETSGGLDAHVHGTAELFVAWTGGDVVIDLVSPAENIFGFEYEPTTDEDIALVAERTATLTAPELLALNAQAACSLVAAVDSDFEVEGSHAEVTASWLFLCDEPGELSELDLTALFTAFPGIEDLDVQWASDSGQSAAELSPSSTILRFE